MRRTLLMSAVVVGLLLSGFAVRSEERDAALKAIGFDQKLGERIDPSLRFTDSHGSEVRLGDLLNDRPVILSLGYYECPMLCSMVFNGVVQSLGETSLKAGRDYQWIIVSIDPTETQAQARRSKNTLAARNVGGETESGWRFLIGRQEQIEMLADSVGFRYTYDALHDQYAHPAGVIVLTPQGRVSKYFFGTDFDAGDLRLGVVEASQNRVGTLVDRLLLRCFYYDPQTGQYNFAVMTVVRCAGGLGAIGVGGLVVLLLRREHRHRRIPEGRA